MVGCGTIFHGGILSERKKDVRIIPYAWFSEKRVGFCGRESEVISSLI
jgi:hypothetical protein